MIINHILNFRALFKPTYSKLITRPTQSPFTTFFNQKRKKIGVNNCETGQVNEDACIWSVVVRQSLGGGQQREEWMEDLRVIVREMSRDIYEKEGARFSLLHDKVIKNSCQLILLPNELLVVVLAHQKLQLISPRAECFNLHKRLVIMGSHFIKEKQLSICQAIALYEAFNSWGAVNITFLIHFSTFLKYSFSQPRRLPLEAIITIFSIYFQKLYHTDLQNVIMDLTLKYLIENASLLQQIPPSQSATTLKYILSLDYNKFYLTEQQPALEFTYQLLSISKDSTFAKQSTLSIQQRMRHMILLIDVSTDIHIIQSRNSTLRSLFVDIEKAVLHFLLDNHHQIKFIIKHHPNLFLLLVFNEGVLKRLCEGNEEVVCEYVECIGSVGLSMSEEAVVRCYRGGRDVVSKKVLVRLQEMVKGYVQKLLDSSPITTELLDLYIMLQNSTHIQTKLQTIIKALTISPLTKQQQQQNLITLSFLLQIHQPNIPHQIINKYPFTLNSINQYLKEQHQNRHRVLRVITSLLALQQNQSKLIQIMRIVHVYIDLQLFPLQLHLSILQSQQYHSHLLNILFHYHHYYKTTTKTQNMLILLSQHQSSNTTYHFLISLFPTPNHSYYKQPNHCFLAFGDFQAKMRMITRQLRQSKYSHLMWNLFVEYNGRQGLQKRAQYVDLAYALFVEMFERETSRKVVALTYLSNYMAQGVVIDRDNRLLSLFSRFIPQILQQKSFHYYCWLQIFFNLHAINGLQFDKPIHRLIIKAYISSTDSSKIKSTLLHFYTAKFQQQAQSSQMHGFITSRQIQEQADYLSNLIEKRLIRIKSKASAKDGQVVAGVKFICILLQSQRDISWLNAQILSFIENCSYRQIAQLASSLKNKRGVNEGMRELFISVGGKMGDRLNTIKELGLVGDVQISRVCLWQQLEAK